MQIGLGVRVGIGEPSVGGAALVPTPVRPEEADVQGVFSGGRRGACWWV